MRGKLRKAVDTAANSKSFSRPGLSPNPATSHFGPPSTFVRFLAGLISSFQAYKEVWDQTNVLIYRH
jgi:hypothetical protein